MTPPTATTANPPGGSDHRPPGDRKDTMLTEHQRQANDYAALLRSLGYDVPVGSTLFGREVTR